eukprot:gene34915-43053_t
MPPKNGADSHEIASRTQYVGDAISWLSAPFFGGISFAFLLAVVLVVVAQLVLSRTVFGRSVVGIGTNEEAMRLAGVDPRPIRIIVFAVTGLLAGLAGLMQSARLEAADPNAGTGMELQVIAAVVIGGTSLMGGRGSVVNTAFGVLIIAVLEAGYTSVCEFHYVHHDTDGRPYADDATLSFSLAHTC